MIELIPGEWRYRDAETKQICPWLVRPVVEMLYGMDLFLKSVFEYGIGDSTKWFHSRGAHCCGVDHDYQWVLNLSSIADVRHWHQDVHYLNSIYSDHEKFKFDIISIDGLYRDKCLKYALNRLAPEGFIIIDNFEQQSVEPNWPETRDLIKKYDLTLEIYKEEGHQDWQTAIVRL